jgi:hypothetical protein
VFIFIFLFCFVHFLRPAYVFFYLLLRTDQIFFEEFAFRQPTGSGYLTWSDCSFNFSVSLERQYQEGCSQRVHTLSKWNRFSGTYEHTEFLHDLAKMTQLNRTTKVQKPLRRCLLSRKLSSIAGSSTKPATATSAASGTANPAEIAGATQAALAATSAAPPGTAKPAENSEATSYTGASLAELPGSTKPDEAIVEATFEIVSPDVLDLYEVLDGEMCKKQSPEAAGTESPKAEETAALEAANFEMAIAGTEQPATDAISDSSGSD